MKAGNMIITCILLVGALESAYLIKSDTVLIQGNEEVQGFEIGKYELTLREFATFIEATNYVTETEKKGVGVTFKGAFKEKTGINWRHDVFGELIKRGDYDKYPVSRITVNDIKAYCEWSKVEIPSIKEWVYAAFGGDQKSKTKYAGSNNLGKVAWYDRNSGEKAHEVGVKSPNASGVYDMSGNLFELVWTLDGADTTYLFVGGSFFHGREDAILYPIERGDGLRLVSAKATESWSTPYLGFRYIKRMKR